MASIKIKNTTNYARTGVVTMGIPFSRGENLQTTDKLVVNGALTGYTDQLVQWYPQGARWDNGAVKYVRATFRTDLTSQEEKTATVTRSNNVYTAIPFNASTALLTNLVSTSFTFSIQGRVYNLPLLNVISNPIEGGGPNDHYVRCRYFSHLPNDPNDAQLKYIWYDIVADIYKDLNHVQFYFRFGYYRFYPNILPSDPAAVDPRMDLVQPVTLQIVGARSKFAWEEYKIPSITTTSSTNRTYVLIDPSVSTRNRFGMGMSHAYKGVLTFDSSSTSEAELGGQILAMAEDWKTQFPITRIVPQNPSYITSAVNARTRSNALLAYLEGPIKNPANRDPYNWPTICNVPDTGQAGVHGLRDYAYGLRGWPIVDTTNYNWIPLLEFTTRQQAVRHNWFYNDNGTPVTPAQIQSVPISIWNGTYHNYYNKYAGFTRALYTGGDVPIARGTSLLISGPDKEHYTNKIHILQAFFTMDWFSLEFAKMYSNYWVSANRTDAIPGQSSAIHDWGSARAIGRTYEVAAYLYEFQADANVKSVMKTRYDYNVARPPAVGLDKNYLPGGTEIIRTPAIYGPCLQGACLGPYAHYRPWEDSQAAFGLFVASKVLLQENPSETHGLKFAEAARDIAAYVAYYGYMDFRSSSNRRAFTILFNNNAELTTFLSGLGGPTTFMRVVGLTSGATGYVYLAHYDDDYWGAVADRVLRLYLRNATGTFVANETVRADTGVTGVVNRVWQMMGTKSVADTSPTRGFLRPLTDAEEEMIGFDFIHQFPSSRYPWGYFKYHNGYYLYEKVKLPCVVIARDAAKNNLYANNNAAIYSYCNGLITHYYNSTYNADNGDYQEDFMCFAGYLSNDLLDSNTVSVTCGVMPIIASTGGATITIINQVVDRIVNAGSASSRSYVYIPTTTVSNSVSVSVSVGTVVARGISNTAAGSAGAVATVGSVGAGASADPIEMVYTTSYNNSGKKVFKYIHMGPPTRMATEERVEIIISF